MRDAKSIERDVAKAWDLYRTVGGSVDVNEAYERWSQLVAELYEVARDRTTRRWRIEQ